MRQLPCEFATLRLFATLLVADTTPGLADYLAETPAIAAVVQTLYTISTWQVGGMQTSWGSEALTALALVAKKGAKGR